VNAEIERAPVNVAAHLPRVAAARPYAPAIFAPAGRDMRGRVRYTHYTYRQLDEASDRIARGLAAIGIDRGARVALMVRPSLELFSITFGLFKAGMVPVLVDPGIGLANMKACLEKAAPEVFIGIPTAQIARVILGWAKTSLRKVITVGPRVPFAITLDDVERAGERASGSIVPTSADDVAAILFTSGSTGAPKGAVYTHGNFAAQVDAIRRMYDIRPGEVDLPTFPLFALFDPALGMTTVIPDMDPTRPAKADPAKIARAIDDFGVTNMFGSPALLNTLGRWGKAKGVRLASLRRVISAGAPVPAHVLARMRAMLSDDAMVVTPYGATECLPVASIESREVLSETAARTEKGEGVCVGRPVPEADVAIIPITDSPMKWSEAKRLAPFEIGEIAVKGPMATRRYFQSENETALAKIVEDERSFRHRMGDLGYLDDRGRLWFCGRKSQRVRIGDRTMFTINCEGVFNAHPDVYRSALVLARKNGRILPVI
jgi:acyl-CoA synthetase (AMP-forming)/AMP-acid ligase II